MPGHGDLTWHAVRSSGGVALATNRVEPRFLGVAVRVRVVRLCYDPRPYPADPMSISYPKLAAVVLLTAAAFFLGRGLDRVDAQDRPGPPPTSPPQNPPTGAQPPVLIYGEEGGSSSSANGILAVTGSYGVGTSVLYVIDTTTKQLAVYEARGGSSSMRRLVLVGARRIDLDLQLEGYNDESEFSFDVLRRRFEKGEVAPESEAPTGLRPGDGR